MTDIQSISTTTPTSAADDINTLLAALKSAKSIDWTSPTVIEGLAVKALGVVAIFHPSLNVGQWEPLIIALSVFAVTAESAIRGWLHHDTHVAALTAAQTVLRQKGNFGAA